LHHISYGVWNVLERESYTKRRMRTSQLCDNSSGVFCKLFKIRSGLLFIIVYVYVYIQFSPAAHPDDSIKAMLSSCRIISLIWVYVALSAYKDYRKARELKEFGDHGTVNGIPAKLI